jgi:hypothetical protein
VTNTHTANELITITTRNLANTKTQTIRKKNTGQESGELIKKSQ